MKKALFICFMLCPIISIANVRTCLYPYNNNYALTIDGHTGILTRTQALQADNNSYNIRAVAVVTAFFSTHTVNQFAQGRYDNLAITPLSYATDQGGNGLQTTKLLNNTIDTVSLPLILACGLNAGTSSSIFSAPILVLYKKNTVATTCSITNSAASVIVDSTAVAATEVTCATADDAVVLNYFFSQDDSYTLLSATDTEQGSLVFSTILTDSSN